MNRKELDKAGRKAVEALRQTKLNAGIPFMINTSMLPTSQCYLEYPDGSIKVVTISRISNDFEILRELSAEQNLSLRKALKLERIANADL